MPDRETDGYYVYVDGVQAGWVPTGTGGVSGLTRGVHLITLTALNIAGESPPSAPERVTA
jgi:hypothetical protein